MVKHEGEERRVVDRFTKDELKELTKEALKEWVEEKFATFGRWTFRAVSAAAFAALIYFILRSNGWVKH